MIDLTHRKRRVRSEEDEMRGASPSVHPRFSHSTMAWIGAGIAVAGLGTSIVGQNNQKKANARAQDQNLAQQDTQNVAQWGNYLMTRGIAPTSQVTPGVLPAAGQYQAVNTRLPLWMTVTPKQPAFSGPVVRRKVPR